MKSTVWFADLRTTFTKNLLTKITIMLRKTGFADKIYKNDLIGIKIHFGEKGNTSYIRPQFVRPVVDFLKSRGAKVFLTDTNTLYVGTRTDSVSHIKTAIENGFAYSVTDAPIIIADGLRGLDGVDVEVEGEILSVAHIAREIMNADGLVVMTHFKGHELFGFGGAIKNLGMGSANREGKLKMHSNVAPYVNEKKCNGCRICLKWCNYDTIFMEGNVAVIVEEKCVGCGACIPVCPEEAIKNRWDASYIDVQKKTAEYALAVYQQKKEKMLFLNFLMNISPACDCYGTSDAPLVPDIGILASYDPVAIDQASVDLVKSAPGLKTSKLKGALSPGQDKFRDVWPEIDWSVQLEHGEKIGLGRREYKIVMV